MTYCKDCKHYNTATFSIYSGWNDPWCNRIVRVDATTGEQIRGGYSVYKERKRRCFGGAKWCGPEAKHFESAAKPKTPLRLAK